MKSESASQTCFICNKARDGKYGICYCGIQDSSVHQEYFRGSKSISTYRILGTVKRFICKDCTWKRRKQTIGRILLSLLIIVFLWPLVVVLIGSLGRFFKIDNATLFTVFFFIFILATFFIALMFISKLLADSMLIDIPDKLVKEIMQKQTDGTMKSSYKLTRIPDGFSYLMSRFKARPYEKTIQQNNYTCFTQAEYKELDVNKNTPSKTTEVLECSECGSEVTETAPHCPNCGADFDKS